jgi:Ca2+:H+ antiporter
MTEAASRRRRIVNGILLAFGPAALALQWLRPEWSAAVFVCGCVALVPLAGFMGHATEGLAARAGSGIGGLLNATFGNAAELILAIAALRAGHPEVVKASLTGAILGNLLLILGLAMLLGGLKHKEQTFSRHSAEATAGLMVLATVALFVPAVFHKVQGGAAVPLLGPMSVAISLVLLVLYGLSLLFQFKTHAHLYGAEADEVEEITHHLSVKQSLTMLVAATVGVAVVSELLVHALEGATKTFGFTSTFVGVVVLATVGNAAEHSTAVLMALRNRMNLGFTIAVESSKQIALFVAPLLVLLSYALGAPMDLEFTTFEVIAVAMAVIVIAVLSLDGRSNWLEGAMLLGVYAILGVAFYFHP